MTNAVASINPDENKQPSLAEEKLALGLALERLTRDLGQAASDKISPEILNEQLSALNQKIEQHQLRFEYKVQDVRDVFTKSNLSYLDRVEVVRGLLGVDFLPIIIHTLGDETAEVRFLSAKAMIGTEDPMCLSALREIGLKDLYVEVRCQSAKALEGTKDPLCLKALCEIGLKDKSPEVRLASIRSLGNTKDRACRQAVKEVIRNDESTYVKQVAIESLRSKQ